MNGLRITNAGMIQSLWLNLILSGMQIGERHLNKRIDNPQMSWPFLLASCSKCGDDIDIHEWIEVENNVIVNCDRK